VYLTIQAAVEEMPSPDRAGPTTLINGAMPTQDGALWASE